MRQLGKMMIHEDKSYSGRPDDGRGKYFRNIRKFYQTIHSEYNHLHTSSRENIKSHMMILESNTERFEQTKYFVLRLKNKPRTSDFVAPLLLLTTKHVIIGAMHIADLQRKGTRDGN